MLIRKGHKQKLKTRMKEFSALARIAGSNRFVWNYFLAKNLYYLNNGMRIMSYVEMNWFLTYFLKKSEEYKFLNDIPSQTLQQTLKNQERAFKDQFDKSKPNKKRPRFKKKQNCKDNGFKFPQGFKVDGNKVFLPKLSLSKLVNSLKGVSSRMLRREFKSEIENFLYKGVLWSPSYFVSSCSGAPISIVKKYINGQESPTCQVCES